MRQKRTSISYVYTIYTCYIGYIVQAIINNLPPLLFLTFQREFGISTEKIGLLITINFGMQIITDSVAAKSCPQGGTLMYAPFALAGDIGCASGPGVVSIVSELLPTYGLKAGLAAAMIFPVVLIILLIIGKQRPKTENRE